MNYILCIVIISISVLKTGESTSKLSVPRVLLPVFKDYSVNFTLEISGEGCYRWSISRPDLIYVKELYRTEQKACSKHATISVLSKELTKKTAMIIADDFNGDRSLRADVIIDVISTLKIVTKSRELYIEEPPQMFEVRAYDNQGNEFTTLEGIEFLWSIHGNVDDSSPVMKLMTFYDSPYETPPSVASFDNIGKHGHMALLEGTRTGSSQVFVRLPHPEYKFVEPAIVQLVVVANLLLEPSSVYILPGNTVDFHLFQVRKGKRYEIKASNQQFALVSQNENIASVNGRKITGLALGKVEIMVLDTYTTDNGTIQLQSALVTVIEPHHMTLSIQPFNTWTLSVGQKATIVPEVFGINDEKIWISDKTLIYNKVPEDIFEVIMERENGSVIGIARRSGYGKVTAELKAYQFEHLFAENTLYVYPKLTITPELLVLPWVPNYTSRLSNFSLKASGGDRNYAWASKDTSIVEVSQTGVLKFTGPGSGTVNVFMKKNKNSIGSSSILLLPPDQMSIFNDLTEATVGDDIYLHISLYGTIKNGSSSERVLFTSCTFLDFVVSPSYPFKSEDDPVNVKPREGACAVKRISSLAVGLGKIIVTLETKRMTLSATTFVAAHSPLISIQPKLHEPIVLALGSSYDIVYAGGPRPRFGPIKSYVSFPGQFFQAKERIVKPELYVVRVTCLNLGTGSLELKLLSRPLGLIGIEVKQNVSISCKVPKSIEIHSNSKSGCSGIYPQRFISYALSKVRFDVKIYDDNGIVFKNATSVLFSWLFDNETVARFDDSDLIKLEDKDHIDFKSAVTHYVTANIFSTFGDVNAEGLMLGYLNARKMLSAFDSVRFPSCTFMLSVVQEPTMEPNFLSIFNHPNNIGYLKIKGGSGHFSFEPTYPVVSINYNYKTRTAEVSPLNEGSGEIIVKDKCLPDVIPTKIEFQVINVASLTITSALKVQEGQSAKVIVRVLDKEDKPLAIPSIPLLKLGLKMKVSNPAVADFEGSDKVHIDYLKGIIELYLKGKRNGETAISVSWMDISSNVVTVQVFPKIRINPRSITLAVGSEIQLKVTGGPSMDVYTNFMVTDPSLITISASAVAKGIRSGDTYITALSMGYQGEVYSKDVIEAHVIPLNGIHIVAPTTKLGLGNSMPVYASGIPHDITPLLLGSISPSLHFKWQLSVPNVAQIRDTLFNTKIQVSNENKLSIRVLALNPGHTTIELHVFGRNPDKTPYAFNSSLEIEVFSKLKWTRPNIDFSYLLMAPNTACHLKTNSVEKEFHSVRSTDVWNSNDGNPLLKVYPDGLVSSGSNFGSAVVAAETRGFDFSTREIALTVQVKPVHYLMINIATVLETTEEVKSLPRGLYLNLTISYHDEYGYEFFVPPYTKPTCQCNICSKVHIEYSGSNHSIITSLASTGNIILRIHDVVSQAEMDDYIKIPVDNYIVPSRAFLTVGEIVCYWTPLVSQSGVWSTDGNIMHIGKDGIAFPERTGSTSVTYSISYPEPVMLASLSVEILPLQSFLIGPIAHRSITNVVGSNYTIPVFLINEKQRKEPTYSKYCNSSQVYIGSMPFVCELHYTSASKLYPVDSLFNVDAEFDVELGSYVCVIRPIKGPTKEISTIESNLTLSVSNRKSIYETFFLNFYPQFLVNVDQLLFTQETSYAYVTVSGASHVLNELYIEPVGQKVISVGKINREHGQLLHFIVQHSVSDRKSLPPGLDVHVLISCRLTLQKEKIPVYFNLDEKPPYHLALMHALSMFLLTFMKIIVSGLLFGNAYYCFAVYSCIFGLWYFRKHLASMYVLEAAKTENYYKGVQIASKPTWDIKKSSESIWREPEPKPSSPPGPLMASPNFLRSTRSRLPQGNSPQLVERRRNISGNLSF